MNIYNMKPVWVQVIEETKERLGRNLTDDEVKAIRESTSMYANRLGDLYNQQLNLQGNYSNVDKTESIINDMTLNGINGTTEISL